MNIVFVNFVKFDNVLVVHLLQNVYFTLEALNLFRVIDWLLFDEFHSSLSKTNLVYASANFAEWALTQLLLNLVDVSETSFSLFYEGNLRDFVQMCSWIVWYAGLARSVWTLRLTILIYPNVARLAGHLQLFSLVVALVMSLSHNSDLFCW